MQDVEVQFAGFPQAPGLPSPLPFDISGFVDFEVAGTDVSGEFRCSDCGYGAVVRRVLPACPMCGGTVWESRAAHFAD